MAFFKRQPGARRESRHRKFGKPRFKRKSDAIRVAQHRNFGKPKPRSRAPITSDLIRDEVALFLSRGRIIRQLPEQVVVRRDILAPKAKGYDSILADGFSIVED